MNMTTYIVSYRAQIGQMETVTLEGVTEMLVLEGDIVVFLNDEGKIMFGLPSNNLISFQRKEPTS